MFGFFKSAESLEKELREWFVEDSVRILGESERNKCIEHGQQKILQYLVEDMATDLKNKQIDAGWHKRLGFLSLLPTPKEAAWRKKGLNLLEAFLKVKGWKMERNAEGYDKLCEPLRKN